MPVPSQAFLYMLASIQLPLIILAVWGMYWPVHPSEMWDLEVRASCEPYQASSEYSLCARVGDSPMEGTPL